MKKKRKDKPKLAISFSGGRTSAVMTKLLLAKYHSSHDIRVVFANTGCEHADTLRFIHDCDLNWNFPTVWVEAVVNHNERKCVSHRIVNFDTASKNGEPFEEVIKKYGIPNQTSPMCTARLKTDVIESYLRTEGFYRGSKLNYDTAIGIRSDEQDRISKNAVKNRFIYPLVKWGWTKQKIIDFMSQFEWDLNIPEHLGNCTWCWKKSLRKHLTLAQDYPEVFSFPAKMERKFSKHKADCPAGNGKGKRYFFRNHLSTREIVQLSKKGDFKRFDDPNYHILDDWDDTLDRRSSCEEICDVYSEEHQ